LNIGVFYSGETLSWPAAQLIEAGKRKGENMYAINIKEMTGIISNEYEKVEVNAPKLDGGFIRGLGAGTTDQITFRISALEHLEILGAKLVNSAYAYRRAKDKYATFVHLKKAGLPVPPTVVTENLKDALNAIKEFEVAVIKPLVGSRGLGSIKVDCFDLGFRVLKTLHRVGLVLYVQKYVPNPGRDLRIFVVGGEIVGSIFRLVNKNEWKTNVARGGKPLPCNPSEEVKEIAIKASETLGLDYSGVDIVEGKEGPFIIEANAAPSWSALQKVTGINIADILVNYLVDKIKK